MHKDKIIGDAINSGKDPIAVRCALDSTDAHGNTNPMCIVKAGQK